MIAPGVALYDVAHLLPGHGGYPARDVRAINRIYVHHSGRLGRAGFEGARNSARYVVEQRGWPGAAYHYWIPYETLRDLEGRLVLLRLQPVYARCYHTGGDANTRGIGVVLQGSTTARPMSYSHVEGLEALLPWLHEQMQQHSRPARQWLSWHAEADRFGGDVKPACPGRHAEQWLRDYRPAA